MQRCDQSTGSGGAFKCFAIAFEQFGLHSVAVVGAAEQCKNAVAMVGEVGVDADPPIVAGAVEAGEAIPRIRRRDPVSAQAALTAEFGGGVAHIDGDVLAAAGT